MRILLIHQAFVSPREGGGTRHYEFAKYCRSQGHEFIVVASDLSYLTGRPVIEKEGFITYHDLEGIHVLRAFTCPTLHRSFVWRIVSFLSFMFSSIYAGMRCGRVDLVMGTSPPIFQAVSAWFVSLLRNRPFLLEIRDLWPEFAIDMGMLKNPVLIKLSRLLEIFLYERSDHILVNSPAYRDYIHKKNISLEKISLIANGVDPTFFDPQIVDLEFRRELGLDGYFVITYAGALGMANDIPMVLKAADRLRDHKNIRFLFVGDGKEKPNLEKMAQRMNIDNVIFIGSRPKSDMPMILATSDVCLAVLMDIPMFRTTYPNKVFDYMAAGRPTILAIDGVIRQVIEAAGGGVFVSPGDDKALSDAVLRLASNPDEVHKMGSAARDYVIKHFNRHDQAKEFVDLVNHIGKKDICDSRD